ncbi:MAG TPA: hypothetical protein ENJ83_04940 [Rhodospirillales bacterium]|nr:hypothetical protein [Rhodospirillales bacterium]
MLELLMSTTTLPYALAIASAGLPLAAVTGFVGYSELQTRLRRMPAAVERETLEHELTLLRERREELRREIQELEGKRGEVEALRVEAETWRERIRQLEEQWASLAARRQEVEHAERELAQLLERLEVTRAEEAEARARLAEMAERTERLAREEAGTKERIEALRHELEARRGQLAEVSRLLEAGRQEVARLGAEVSRRREELTEAEEKLARIEGRARTLGERIAELQKERDGLQRQVADMAAAQREVERLHAERQRLDPEVKRLEAERTALEQRIAAAREELAAVRREVERAFENLQVVVEQDSTKGDEDALAEFHELPTCFVSAKARETMSEEKALDDLRAHLQRRGLHYPKRVLEAFHTCLKIADISPLTVLAGISGTGKSALPREYADALGMDFLVVPVQPRWDGPQDLIGFYNYVEGRFKPTELARALVRFDRGDWKDLVEKDEQDVSGRMLLVLLDEMNLARVEYYFSDFLSLLEIRRDSPERAWVPVDLGHGRSRRLRLTDNVLYVGTMNEDESTQTLSDKVLDRANVIRFTRPRRLQAASGAHEGSGAETPRLTRRIWESWCSERLDGLPEVEDLAKQIEELNGILERLGRPFGHRLFQAICRYYANHPASRRGDPGAREIALADQLEFRILPKLRGIETDFHHEALDELRGYIDRLDDAALAQAFEWACEAELFLWPGAARDDEA